MEQLTLIALIIGYLATLAWSLKEAFYEQAKSRHLQESNRELHRENQYYKEKLENYYSIK
jgi:hypothetical protein